MYQEYQNDQFQDEQIGQNLSRGSVIKNQSYEQQMIHYVSKESILPKILPKQKSIKQQSKIKQPKEKKKLFSSLHSQKYESIPKKSFSQYSVFNIKSRAHRFESLDVNKNKTIEKQQEQFLLKNNKKKNNHIQRAKLKNSVSIKQNEINLRISNKINKKLALNATNQTELQKIQHYFSHSKIDLQKMTQDQLNRTNNRLYQWIQKYNRKLDELLNSRLGQQCKKKNINQNNTNKIIQLLGKHVQNNKDLLIRIDQENKKLQNKSGLMKEQQYQFLLYKQIEKIAQKIKEEAKNIIVLKKKNQLSGTKIVSQQDSKVYQQKMTQIKLQIVKGRKQEDSNTIILQQLESKYLKTKANLQKSNQSLKNLLRQAEQKQINLNESKLDDKWIQLKIKVQKFKTSIKAALVSIQRNVNKIIQENRLLRNQIRQYEQDIEDLSTKIDLISEKLQSINQQTKETNITKASNLNSKLYSYKNKKEVKVKIMPINHTFNKIQSENKRPDEQKIESLQPTPNIQEVAVKLQLKSPEETVRQQKESQCSNDDFEIIQNSLKNEKKNADQQDINEFMDLKLDKMKDQPIQQRQNVSISPVNNHKQNKLIQNVSETLPVQQYNRKKSTRRFFIKKSNKQDQE